MGSGFAPQKRFSQNFLTDVSTARSIAEALQISAGDNVVEIGPGKGALTVHLCESSADRIVGVELDDRAVQFLCQQSWVRSGRVQIVSGDALALRVQDLLPSTDRQHRCIIGNIPYSITSPLLFWLFSQAHEVSRGVIMMQREVARRCVAGVGSKDYGILSVATWLHARARLMFHVKPGSFFPRPDVVSSVVRFDLLAETPMNLNVAAFMEFVRAAFSQRRKVMTNALADWARRHHVDLKANAPVCAIDLAKTRAEECPPQLLGEIFLCLVGPGVVKVKGHELKGTNG